MDEISNKKKSVNVEKKDMLYGMFVKVIHTQQIILKLDINTKSIAHCFAYMYVKVRHNSFYNYLNSLRFTILVYTVKPVTRGHGH